jgi:hypothetical protein
MKAIKQSTGVKALIWFFYNWFFFFFFFFFFVVIISELSHPQPRIKNRDKRYICINDVHYL